jgi:hypothetical protein
MHVAFDLDNTLDTSRIPMQSLVSALKAAGHTISNLTGCSNPTPTAVQIKEKVEYLEALGFGDLWDWLVVIGDPPHERKAEIVHHGAPGQDGGLPPVDILFDNSLHNARLASKHCLVMVPWNTVQD